MSSVTTETRSNPLPLQPTLVPLPQPLLLEDFYVSSYFLSVPSLFFHNNHVTPSKEPQLYKLHQHWYSCLQKEIKQVGLSDRTCLVLGRWPVWILAKTPITFNEISLCFSSVCPSKSCDISLIRLTACFKLFTIYYSIIIPWSYIA